MMVYGDPSFPISLGELVERLRSSPPARSLDEARTLLVLAGQLEQAASDEGAGRAMARCQTVTDAAADVFLAWWLETQAGVPLAPPDPNAALSALRAAFDDVPFLAASVRVKIPEGFAFYALYPEAYCLAALRWMEEHAPTDPVLVIGLRSIGTTLSALVAATLRAGGRKARRLTVRPTGHPFGRQADIDPKVLGNGEWALVVDEGPGLSGSSMASVAEAVLRTGLDRDRIAFFPGHGGEPGGEASPDVRAWWEGTSRYVLPTEELRWEGRSLERVLADRTAPAERIEKVEELTGGQWRRLVFDSEGDWPAVATSFERRKIRVIRRDGTSVLWSFVGFASSPEESPEKTLASRAADGWTPSPLGTALGFLATPWIEGRPLARNDASPRLLAHIGRYIAAVAGPALAFDEGDAARQRLIQMFRANTGEDLPPGRASVPEATYGDGRLAPHEWIRMPDGRILKTDGLGHARDHTMVGRQSVAWDVAGAMVEWGLDETAAAPLLAAAPMISSEDLGFYRAAYAAFRLGMCSMCAAMSHDPAERARLQQDEAFYWEALSRMRRGEA